MTNNLDFVFVNKAFQALKNKGEKRKAQNLESIGKKHKKLLTLTPTLKKNESA